MRVIEPKAILEDQNFDGIHSVALIENIGRVCYKSEAKQGANTTEIFIKNLIKKGHTSVLEHVSVPIRVICDRGVSHEIVRHRIASYSQESTRYCNYTDDRFGNELTFIKPCFWDTNSPNYSVWEASMKFIENEYFIMVEKQGAKPQEARSILPNSLKTELVMTMNLREWRAFFGLRCDKAAHPQMRQTAFQILDILSNKVPYIFDDIVEKFKDNRIWV